MKKFAKILTVLLTVCLLAGVVTATVVSAADFEEIKALNNKGSGFTMNSKQTGVTRAAKNFLNEKEKNNGYTQFLRDESKTGEVTSTNALFTPSVASNLFNAYSYVVIDFDFMSDFYLTSNGALDANEGDKLAYTSGLSFYHDNDNNHKCYIIENNNLWYASSDESYDANDILLANKAGVMNHLTYVVDGQKGLSYFFIDGQFLSSDSVDVTSSNNRFIFDLVDGNIGYFSIGIDNTAMSGYPIGYKDNDTIDGNSIADYFGDNIDTSILLSNCDDIIYNEDYTYDTYALASQVAASVGDEDYKILSAALKALKNPELTGVVTIETRKSIVNAEISENVSELKVKCTDGATFSAEGFNAGEADANGYVTYTKAVKVNATWCDANGSPITGLDAEEIAVGTAVTVPETAVDAYLTKNSGINGTATVYEWSANADFTSANQFNLSDGIENVSAGTAIYIRPVTATVTWKGVGTVADVTETWYVGSTLTAGDLTSFPTETDIEGWTAYRYTGWEGFVEGTTTVNADVAYNPVKTLEAAVSYKANITLFDAYVFNIYVKVPGAESGISNVKFDGVDAGTIEIGDDNNKVAHYIVTSAEKDYRGNSGSYSPVITFTAGGNEFSFTATVTTVDYVTKALDNAEKNNNEIEEKLLVNFANYIYQCAIYNGEAADSEIQSFCKDLVEEHSTCCLSTEVINPNAGAENLELGCLISYKPYVSGEMVKYVYFVLCVPNTAEGEVSATFNGIDDNKTNQTITVNFLAENDIYNALKGKEETSTQENYQIYISNEYAIYNLLETMEITVGENTITYNIADYIEWLESGNGSDKDIDLMKSLYGFAEAAKAFKMEGATLAE